MKLTSVCVLILAGLFQGSALAANATKTQVLFSGVVAGDTALNVSACAQIRVTASAADKGGTPGSVFLWDDSAPSTDLLAAPLRMYLDDTNPYQSALLETPGLTLTIGGSGGATAIVYCR